MLRFGIELEVAAFTFEKAESLLGQLNMKDWVYKGDISIAPTGVEFNSPILEWHQVKNVMPLIKALPEAGAITNHTCGIHIHMSGDFPSFEDSIPIFHRWYAKHRREFRPCEYRRMRTAKEVFTSDDGAYGKGKLIHNWAPGHLELRLFDAKLDCKWMARCLVVTKQLGVTLEKIRGKSSC